MKNFVRKKVLKKKENVNLDTIQQSLVSAGRFEKKTI